MNPQEAGNHLNVTLRNHWQGSLDRLQTKSGNVAIKVLKIIEQMQSSNSDQYHPYPAK